MKEIQDLYPSYDGNPAKREEMFQYIKYMLSQFDSLKDPDSLFLGQSPSDQGDYYNQLIQEADIPYNALSIPKTIDNLMELAQGHRYSNKHYTANATPLPNIPSMLGNMMMVLLNGNNLWDVEGSGAAQAEVKVTSMLSKLVGYDPTQSAGYTTWGGQGAVFNSLRLAIARRYPESNYTGVPNNLYCFCSELSHYSLYKSMEASGIGIGNLVRVKVNEDHSMNTEDLKEKMNDVVQNGGVPLYVLATMGTTDTFGIDDIEAIQAVTKECEFTHRLDSIYIHADSAMGGMYTFFNDYDLNKNPLNFSQQVCQTLNHYQQKLRAIRFADSMVFDFHKLGQTPYITSLFLIKDKTFLQYVDLAHEETPYVGNRSYGSYHTSYTLECSRMGSSIPIYASLLGMGIEGYQRLLGHYLEINAAFRKKLQDRFSNVAISNELAPVTTFRFYPDQILWEEERQGNLLREDVEQINQFNDDFGELIGEEREKVYFGNTRKQRLIPVSDTESKVPVFAHKFFPVSPYSTLEDIDFYVEFLEEHMTLFKKTPILV